MGYEKIAERIQQILSIGWGETTEDKRFTLLPMACLGNCDRAPTLMINDELHSDVTIDNIEDILNKYQ